MHGGNNHRQSNFSVSIYILNIKVLLNMHLWWILMNIDHIDESSKILIIFIGTPELCGPALYFMAQLQIYFHRAAQRRQAWPRPLCCWDVLIPWLLDGRWRMPTMDKTSGRECHIRWQLPAMAGAWQAPHELSLAPAHMSQRQPWDLARSYRSFFWWIALLILTLVEADLGHKVFKKQPPCFATACAALDGQI